MLNTPRFLEEGGKLFVQSAETAVQDGAQAFSQTVAAFTPIAQGAAQGARAVQDGLWSGMSAVARSVSRSFSAGPSYSRLDEAERRKSRAAYLKEYQKVQWVDAMERNLKMLRQIIEHRRKEMLVADMSNDLERKKALEAEIKELKIRQARLSCALWVQPEDLPSSRTLLEMENPQQVQAELEAILAELGLIDRSDVEPGPSKADAATSPDPVFDVPVAVAPRLPQQPTDLPDSIARLPEGALHNAQGRGHGVQGERPQTPRRRPEGKGTAKGSKSNPDGQGATHRQAPEGKGQLSEGKGDGKGKAEGDTGGKTGKGEEDPDGGTGGTTSTPMLETGKGGKKGPPLTKGGGKGGKKGPPIKGEIESDAGKGGKGGRKGPPAKGGRIRKVTPLGRRFHWKELNEDKVKGTVFDKGDSSPMDTIDLQFDGLKSYFADGAELSKQGASPRQPADEQVCIFDSSRVQNVAIVLRGVFGQMPTPEDMDSLAMGLEAVDAARAGPLAPLLRDVEKVALLPSAMPTDEEAKQLKEHPPERLRLVERLVLPLALPKASKRLRALRLDLQAETLHGQLQARMEALSSACQALKESLALRRFLRTVAKLGSWINSADPEMEKGFAVSSALGKLRLFRAVREDKTVSLLHIAVLAASGAEVSVVQSLCSTLALELECLDQIAREDISDLDQAVKHFATEEAWLLRESEGDYPLNVRARLRAIHQEQMLPLRQRLEESWRLLRGSLSETLRFFAEGEAPSLEAAAEQLFKSLHIFKKEVAAAAAEILAQPQRFMRAYAAGTTPAAEAKPPRPGRTRSVSTTRLSAARRGSGPAKVSLADRVAMQNLTADQAQDPFGLQGVGDQSRGRQ